METTRERRPITRLGLWLTGPWPRSAGNGVTDRHPADGSDASESSVLDRVAELAGIAERSGFDSLWVTDKVPPVDPDTSGHADPEAYSLLGALAARTLTARLGAVPLVEDRRPPSLVAKIVTGIDVISHGRALLTYGLGPADPVRGARVVESLRVGRSLLEDESPTFRGNFYTVVDAKNRPSPVQAGGIPVVVFIERPADLATVAVTEFVGLADAVIAGGDPGEVRGLVHAVRSAPHPAEHGRREEVGPLQVIGVVPMQKPYARSGAPQSDDGPVVHHVVSWFRDLLDAGVDGCLVPVDLATPPEAVATIAAALVELMASRADDGGASDALRV